MWEVDRVIDRVGRVGAWVSLFVGAFWFCVSLRLFVCVHGVQRLGPLWVAFKRKRQKESTICRGPLLCEPPAGIFCDTQWWMRPQVLASSAERRATLLSLPSRPQKSDD